MDGGAWWAAVHGVAKSRAWLGNFPFTFHFHALEKEMATHSSILAWRIPGTESSGLLSMGSHRVGLNWSDLAAAAVCFILWWFIHCQIIFFLIIRCCCCSVTKLWPILGDTMDCSMPGFSVLHYFPVCSNSYPLNWWCHSIILSSFIAFNLSQCQGLFQRVSSFHQVAKVLELQLQTHSFQWIFRIDFL